MGLRGLNLGWAQRVAISALPEAFQMGLVMLLGPSQL